MSDTKNKVNDGGPPFPTENAREKDAGVIQLEGMTIRDYFAAKAMAAMFQGFSPASGRAPDIYLVCAREAYAVADAMLWARGKD